MWLFESFWCHSNKAINMSKGLERQFPSDPQPLLPKRLTLIRRSAEALASRLFAT